MMTIPKTLLFALAVACGLSTLSTAAFGEEIAFKIDRFQIQGNSLLNENELAELTAPHTGAGKSFADIQLALEALERAYRAKGFSAVAVTLPEQEITQGVVTFNVVEARLGKIKVKGAKYFSEKNILRSLPRVVPGDMPHALTMADAVARANENPAKEAEVVLRISDKPGLIDADIAVEDEDPSRFVMSLDNTGMGTTVGDFRLGLAWQQANLFDRDHVLTLQYTTSPDHHSDVKMFNAGYHIPFYGLGDSLDLFAGYSNVDAGAVAVAGGPSLNFAGSGDVFGLRYNHHLPRNGQFEHKLTLGLDYKAYDNTCSFIFFGQNACGKLGEDVTSHPASIGYLGVQTRPGAQTLYSLSYSHNIPGGKYGTDDAYIKALCGDLLPCDGASADFGLWRYGISHLQILPKNWQTRVSLNGQWTNQVLIPGEQIGLSGATLVRGFNEREVARDRGYVVNLELFTPDLGARLPFKGASLRGLLFYDLSKGQNIKQLWNFGMNETAASAGLGLRYSHKKNLSVRLDIANVLNPAGSQHEGDWKMHFQLTGTF